MITKASVFNTEIKVILCLQFMEDIPISFLIKVITQIQDFKT